MLEKERMEVVKSKSANSSFSRPRGDSLKPIFLCASSLPQPSTAAAKTAAISRHGFIDMNCLPAHEEDEEQEEEGHRANLLPFSLTVERSSNSSSSSLFACLATSTKAAGLNSGFNLCSNNSSHCNYGDVEQEEEEEEEEEEDVVGGGDGGATKKKLRLSKEQSGILEESFREHSSLNPKLKNVLAAQLDLKPRQVEVWFQNRRARTKLKKTEVECEVLKRCCSSLTEENRRLQKEVQELRALKVPPPSVYSQDYFMALPATTLSMCPSCEKIASNSIDNSLTNQSLQYSHFFPQPLRQSSTAS